MIQLRLKTEYSIDYILCPWLNPIQENFFKKKLLT